MPVRNDTGSGTTISWANLDGSASGDLTITGSATVDGPHGIAIDPVAHKLYWTNVNNNTIDVANLDGSNSAVLAVNGEHARRGPGVTVNQPRGPGDRSCHAKDLLGQLADGDGTTISWSSLDGAERRQPDRPAGPPWTGPRGWRSTRRPAGFTGATSAATSPPSTSHTPTSTAGSADNLDTTGPPAATVDQAHGVAIDPTTGTIYWANFYDNVIARAQPHGGGGDDFLTAASVSPGGMDNPDLPLILRAPEPQRAPRRSPAAATTGSTPQCTQGSWAPDIIARCFYRAPHSYAYQWSRDGSRHRRRHLEYLQGRPPPATTAAGSPPPMPPAAPRRPAPRTRLGRQGPDPARAVMARPSNKFRLGRLIRQ